MLTLFAHEGHAHASNFLETVEGAIFINLAPFALLALLAAIMHVALKLPKNIQLVFVLAYLLLVGLLGYQIMPVASVISFVAGFGLSLALVIFPFKKRKPKAKNTK